MAFFVFYDGVSPDSIVKALSGEKQGVAIGRALHFDADLIVLDEPTIALSITETRKVHTQLSLGK